MAAVGTVGSTSSLPSTRPRAVATAVVKYKRTLHSELLESEAQLGHAEHRESECTCVCMLAHACVFDEHVSASVRVCRHLWGIYTD